MTLPIGPATETSSKPSPRKKAANCLLSNTAKPGLAVVTYDKSTKQFDRQIDAFKLTAILISAIHLCHHICMRT